MKRDLAPVDYTYCMRHWAMRVMKKDVMVGVNRVSEISSR